MDPSISIKDLRLSFGAADVLKNLNLDIGQGEFLVLLGSSGCGKSTLLNCIAGLLDVSDGQIFINGRNVTWEEPSKRGIGMVFQSYALYPQMTVAGNLSFGLKNAGLSKANIAERIARASKVLQIEPLLNRKPAALSGGQRQRVAIGRALVRDVEVFLFDEPLSNLDAKLRADLRIEIKQLHHTLENTMIYVTHDQIEAMTLADRIVLLKDGLIEQQGAPLELFERPATRFVAGFLGSPSMNFIPADLRDGALVFSDGRSLALPPERAERVRSGSVIYGVRPEHISTGTKGRTGLSHLTVTIDLVQPTGSRTYGTFLLGGVETMAEFDAHDVQAPGEQVELAFDMTRSILVDPETERVIA